MVDMDKKEQILHYHRIDGLSQREIARRVGASRKTVKRYITEYETLAQVDPEDGINMCLSSEPQTCLLPGGRRYLRIRFYALHWSIDCVINHTSST